MKKEEYFQGIIITKEDKVVGPRIFAIHPPDFMKADKSVAIYLWEKINRALDVKIGSFLQTIDPFTGNIILMYPFKILDEQFAICLYFTNATPIDEWIKELEFITQTVAGRMKQGLNFQKGIEELTKVTCEK